jgi:glycosyltransferase involved in cell wall biosynthesis
VKIAIVIGRLGRGGSERQVVEFVRSTHPSHADCTVICLGDAGPLAEQVRACGARVVALGAERFGGPRVLVRLARTLRRERADVIYALLFWGYTLALPLAALAAPRACRIQGRRSLPDVDVPRHRRHKPLRGLANRLSHGVIVNSIGVGSAVAESEPSLAGRIWVVPNGVVAAETRRGEQERDGPVRIVCVANLIAYKGHATFIAALARLSADGWLALLIGDGPERAAIEGAIATRGLRDRVVLLGAREDVHEQLERADIAVLPSYTEGLPNAVMEAMAHGVPVVASDVGGVCSLLGSGAGVLVPPGDELALAAALQALIDDEAARRRMGRVGLRMAHGSLTVEKMRDATLRAVNEVQESRHGGRPSAR